MQNYYSRIIEEEMKELQLYMDTFEIYNVNSKHYFNDKDKENIIAQEKIKEKKKANREALKEICEANGMNNDALLKIIKKCLKDDKLI